MPPIISLLPVLGSIVMGLCSVALFWATVRLGRADPDTGNRTGKPDGKTRTLADV